MSALPSFESLDRDQFITLRGVSWSQYESVLAIRGDNSGVRLCYVEGQLQFMSPSQPHEGISKCLGRLLEAWAQVAQVDVDGVGSWTVRRQEVKRGAEPDQCYIRGAFEGEARPDLAIEVVWTSGGLDKLQVWVGLEVPEVWIWRDGLLTVHCLDGGQYQAAEQSRVFPELDVALLAQFVTPTGQSRAVRAYLAALRRPQP